MHRPPLLTQVQHWANTAQTDHVTLRHWPLTLEVMAPVADAGRRSSSIRMPSLKFVALGIRKIWRTMCVSINGFERILASLGGCAVIALLIRRIIANKNCNNYVTATVVFNPTVVCDNRVPNAPNVVPTLPWRQSMIKFHVFNNGSVSVTVNFYSAFFCKRTPNALRALA